jgi:hypothetical protein
MMAWWVRPETQVALLEDLSGLAIAMGVATQNDPEASGSAILAALRTKSHWLVVFDNVAAPTMFADGCPSGLAMSSLRAGSRGWGGEASQIDLGEFSRREFRRCCTSASRTLHTRLVGKIACGKLGQKSIAPYGVDRNCLLCTGNQWEQDTSHERAA